MTTEVSPHETIVRKRTTSTPFGDQPSQIVPTCVGMDLQSLDETTNLSDSMRAIREQVEVMAHAARHLYAGAVRVSQSVENPDLDLWASPFKLHERARPWAKKNMVASTSSLWQVHETLVNCAKKENRILTGSRVRLSKAEAAILDIGHEEPVAIWEVLARLPKFFV